MRSLRGIAAAWCCVTLVACSGGSGGSGGAGSAEAAARYGQAPARSPAGFGYQPDVVVLDGGAGVVRSVSADGLVWTIDGGTRGVGDLDVGKVMFLTSRAAGRVVAKERSGHDVAVTLAPVQLNEIIRDGHIKIDTTVDAATAVQQEIPDLPGALGVPDATGNDLPPAATAPNLGTMSMVRRAEPARRLPPPARSKLQVTVGRWNVTTAVDPKGVLLSLSSAPSEPLKVFVDVLLGFKKLRVSSDTTLVGGKVSGTTTTVVNGVDFLDVKVRAGAANGADDNKKVRIEIPAELLNKPIMVHGVPMVLNLKAKLFAETALTGKNSTLTASGRWGLSGPIGLANGTPERPGFSVVNSIIDSIGGITLGPSGIVFGAEFKFMVGVGIPGAAAGPYTKLRFSAGVANGSAFGAPLARCTRADLVLKGGGGFGLSLGTNATEALRKAIPRLPSFKADLEAELLGTIKQASQTRPNVPLCVGGG